MPVPLRRERQTSTLFPCASESIAGRRPTSGSARTYAACTHALAEPARKRALRSLCPGFQPPIFFRQMNGSKS